MMKRILITGALGFLGSQLCDRFACQGYDVIGLDSRTAGTVLNIKHLLCLENFNFIDKELNSRLSVEGGLDYILHVVPPGGAGCALASHYLLELAQAKNARMLITSTAELEADVACNPHSEAYWGTVDTVGPFGVYEEATRFWKAMTNAYYAFSSVESSIQYMFKTYGPRMQLKNGRELPAFIATHLVS